MATNHSMTLIHADSTFSIKLMEPITSAVITMVVVGTSLALSSWCSLPLIVCGAVGFIGNPFTDMNLSYGAWYAMISNVILAIRNLGIKFINKEKNFAFRPYKFVVGYYSILLSLGTALYCIFGSNVAVVSSFFYLSSSATFHVVYSYVSTGIVLQYLSVVSHSVANIWKRILVVLLLYSVGHRHTSSTNVLFLLLCITGLLTYVYGQSSMKIVPEKDVTAKSRWRLKMALLVSVVCIFIFDGSIGQRITGFSNSYTSSRTAKEPSRGLGAYEDQQPSLTPSAFQTKLYDDPKIKEFLSWRLIDHYNETDILAQRLNTTFEVMREARRIIVEMASDIFGTYKYAYLMDMVNFENKGDTAINIGELSILRTMGIEVIYNCDRDECTDKALATAKAMSQYYPTDQLVILCSGGGNMGGYLANDYLRGKIMKAFPDHKIVIFPQSTWFREDKHLKWAEKAYNSHKDLTIMLRDRVSLEFVRKHFPSAKSINRAYPKIYPSHLRYHLATSQRW